jgi:predicted esterase
MNKTLLLILFIVPIASLGQTFEKSVVAANGERIGFLEYRPPDYSGPKHPMIIFLHGIGEKGNGTTQLKKVNCCGIPSYIRGGNKMRFTWQGKTESFVVISPQLSKKYSRWQSFYTEELIKYAKASLNIDTDRIFVTGLSLGGGGTWSYSSSTMERAENLAGIAPVVAPCMMTNGCNIAKASLPVFAIHVWDDKDAPATCTVNAIKEINNCNPSVTPNLIMYASGGHYVWIHRAFDTAHKYQDPNLYEWFLAQNRKFAPNKKPLAKAGPDQTISTSDTGINLSASASSDPDGSIVRYIWKKISGPDKGTLAGTNTNTLKITGLTTSGTYKYRLKVIDNRAEWSYDTAAVIVTKGDPTPNSIPLAKAGTDTTIQFPADLTLNGSASSDPDGNITGFLWTKIDGPENYALVDPWNMKTAVTGLTEGTYTFRLEVTDNRDATSTDDITVTVKGVPDPDPDDPDDPDQQIQPPPPVSSQAIMVYPNPSKSNITLVLNSAVNGNALVIIYDNMGRLMKKVSFFKSQNSFQQTLNTLNLGSGLFYVEVIIGTGTKLHTKFIKQ